MGHASWLLDLQREWLRLPARECSALDAWVLGLAAAEAANEADRADTGALALPPASSDGDAAAWPEGEVPPDPVVESPSTVDKFWLMSISCSRLFTDTSWLMYSLGSVSAVGSWFCISVTSSVRKSLAEMAAEELLESLELLELLEPVAVLAMGVAPATASACPAVNW